MVGDSWTSEAAPKGRRRRVALLVALALMVAGQIATVAYFNTRLERDTAEIADLRAALSGPQPIYASKADLGAVRGDVGELSTKADQLRVQVSNIGTRLGAVEKAVGVLSTRMSQPGDLDFRVSQVEMDVQALSNCLDGLIFALNQGFAYYGC